MSLADLGVSALVKRAIGVLASVGWCEGVEAKAHVDEGEAVHSSEENTKHHPLILAAAKLRFANDVIVDFLDLNHACRLQHLYVI